MPVHNQDIAAVFEEMADLLDIRGDNPFRIRAYRNAARTVLELGRELREMVEAKEDLTALPGIGDDLSRKIEEIVRTGTAAALQKLRAEMPAGLTEMLRIPNLGPKRVKSLHKELGVQSLEQLEKAARDGKIRDLAGFGEKTEQHILDALKARALTGKRFLRAAVTPYAGALLAWLEKIPGVQQVAPAGSFRRAKETVGDLDMLVVAEAGSPVMDRFVQYDEVKHVLAKGETKSSVLLQSDIQVDLRVVETRSFGAALNYFTGSKAHNIAIRRLGQQRGLKINEYGVFRDEKYIGGRTEQEVYAAVDLPWIPPELREDSGEIEAAREGKLPELVRADDLRGDLHMHTAASDGQNSIAEMALAARALGYEYIAITEHSKRLTVARGLDEKRLMEQSEEIDRLNNELKGFTVLKGVEVDILEDGKLDLPDDVLKRLDLVIASIHSKFNLPVQKQTERIMRAMDRPCFTMLAHPSGRLLLEREPYAVDIPRLIQHAKERGCFMELNAHPLRLDLNDLHCRMARENGVKVCINTDAHGVSDLDNARFGIGQARRGWLEKRDVLNTHALKQLKSLFARTMGK